MTAQSSRRPPRPALRWALMLVGVAVVFGGVFLLKAFFAKQTNNFFDNMPQPAVAVSSYVAKTQRWTDNGEAVGTFVAINGTDITTEAGGVVRAIEFQPGQRVSAGTVLFRLNAANEEATLAALETSAKLAETLKARVGKDVKVKVAVDESLIGGLVVKLGSTMIDTSIKSKLAALQNAMKEVG